MKLLTLEDNSIAIPLKSISLVRFIDRQEEGKYILSIYGDFPVINISYDHHEVGYGFYKTVIAALEEL